MDTNVAADSGVALTSDLAAECNGCFDVAKASDVGIALQELLKILHSVLPPVRSLGNAIVKKIHIPAHSNASPRMADRVARYWGADDTLPEFLVVTTDAKFDFRTNNEELFSLSSAQFLPRVVNPQAYLLIGFSSRPSDRFNYTHAVHLHPILGEWFKGPHACEQGILPHESDVYLYLYERIRA